MKKKTIKIPTRISVNPREKGFMTVAERKRFEILLDGKPVTKLITADSEAGYVVRNKTDENGKLVVENEYYVPERLNGTVEIRLKEDA